MPSYRRSFMSHAHADNSLCDPYAEALRQVGAPHYYDRETPQHGALLPYLLQEEVRKARTLVVMITPAAQASPWVKLEVAMFHHLMASDPDRALVWVRLVDCAVEPLFAAHLGIDAVGRPLAPVVADLTRALEDHTTPWPTAPVSPAASAPHGASAAPGYSRVVDWRSGAGDFTTITEAIAAASPGERILVRKGLYDGPLNISASLEIVGDGQPGDVEVRASGQNTIEFTGSQGRVANLAVRQTASGDWAGVNIRAGRLELEDCDISSQGGVCISIHDGADPRIRRCRLHDGKQGGLFVYDNGAGLIEDCDIISNAHSGVEVKAGGSPVVRRCRIHHNGYEAIWILERGGGVYEENDLRDNARGAWDISTDSKANVTRRGNVE